MSVLLLQLPHVPVRRLRIVVTDLFQDFLQEGLHNTNDNSALISTWNDLNIKLTLNYIQRIDKHLYSNGKLYQYSDTMFATRRFNFAKDGEAFLFLPDVWERACASHVTHSLLTNLQRGQANDVKRLSYFKKSVAWYGLWTRGRSNIDWLIDWLVGCLTVRQHSKVVPTAGDGNRLSRLRTVNKIQCIIPHVTR